MCFFVNMIDRFDIIHSIKGEMVIMEYTLKKLIEDKIVTGLELASEEKDFSDTVIRKANVQEMPIDEFVEPGDIVLTIALGSENDPDYFDKFIKSAAASQAAGIMFAFKEEKRIPVSAIDLANKNGIAVFTIPWEEKFIDIQNSIIRAVSEEELRVFRSINSRLEDIFYNGDDIKAAAECIGKNLRCDVLVEDNKGKPLAQYGGKMHADCRNYNLKNTGNLYLFSPDPKNEDIYNKNAISRFILPMLSLWLARKQIRDISAQTIIESFRQSHDVNEGASDALAGILKYDDASGSMELLKTLRTYIMNNYNVSETARKLFIHRQSLLARLQKIEDLTGMSLKDHYDLFVLEVFARGYEK